MNKIGELPVRLQRKKKRLKNEPGNSVVKDNREYN